MSKVLVTGGGHAGFGAAWQPEKRLRRGEAEGGVAPWRYMTYQPLQHPHDAFIRSGVPGAHR